MSDKTNIKVEVEGDFLQYDYDKEEVINKPIHYYVNAVLFYPYSDRDNYTQFREEPVELLAESIESLYEDMAKCVIDHEIDGEKRCRDWGESHLSGLYTVEFSDLFIKVGYYSGERMKATKTYRNIGAARDAAKEKERIEKEVAEKAYRERLEKDKERRDKEEYERLSKKFNKTNQLFQ